MNNVTLFGQGEGCVQPDVVGLKPSRRRLARNVVCMFDEDRTPIVQHGRGRYPRGVARITDVPLLRIGVLAEVVQSRFPGNIGARILITGHDASSQHSFEGRSLDIDLEYFELGRTGTTRVVWFKAAQLRRLWTDKPRGERQP